MKIGTKVRWTVDRKMGRIRHEGRGRITRAYPALGNCPITYEVDTYRDGVLFEDEVALDRRRRRRQTSLG